MLSCGNRSLLIIAALAGLGLMLSGCASETSAPASGARVEPSKQNVRDDTADGLGVGSGWRVVWRDEFAGNRLDRKKWKPEESCWGGGNAELQCYTDRVENVEVGGGVLRLKAREETWTGPYLPTELQRQSNQVSTQPYTSGKVRTRGLAEWTYGRFAARIRLPEGQGTWSAFWMLSADRMFGSWPMSGEIDIMEAVNLGAKCLECGDTGVENRVQGALHFGGKWPENTFIDQKTTVPGDVDPSADFHVYAVEWAPGRIDWYVDDKLYLQLTSEDWYTTSALARDKPNAPFDQPFYLMLNLAVGGRLSTTNNSEGIAPDTFPTEVQVDWVRVYECEADPETALACMRPTEAKALTE